MHPYFRNFIDRERPEAPWKLRRVRSMESPPGISLDTGRTENIDALTNPASTVLASPSKVLSPEISGDFSDKPRESPGGSPSGICSPCPPAGTACC